jgi:sorbitol/mannitol transport system substrate-binding protein
MRIHRTSRRRLAAAGALALTTAVLAACSNGTATGGAGDADEAELDVAVAAIPQTTQLEQLLATFEEENPGITVKLTTLDEVTLADKLAQQVSTQSGEFDAVMGDATQVSAWAGNDWLVGLDDYLADDADYGVDDLLPPMRAAVSNDDQLWALPFSGESSYLFYRTDLFEQAGLTMPEQPTWDQVQQLAAQLDDAAGVSGICLRGQASWGSNMPTIVNLVHAHGGYLYDEDFEPGLSTPEAKAGVQQYVDTLRESGEKGAASSSFQECYNLYTQGKVAIWYDSTAISGPMFDPAESEYADRTAVAPTPVGAVDGGGWLSAWTFALLKTSDSQDAAWKFVRWVTSKDYIDLVGSEFGWGLVPPGTRESTYQEPAFQETATGYADTALEAISGARVDFTDLGANELERSFYVDMPQWQATGDELGRIFAAVLTGDKSVDEACAEADEVLAQAADDGGYR